jgi:hypothetical protein
MHVFRSGPRLRREEEKTPRMNTDQEEPGFYRGLTPINADQDLNNAGFLQ